MKRSISRAVLMTKPDEALVTLAREGSDAAFAAIVDRYSRRLHRHCRRFLSDDEAQDAVQQTFVRVLATLRSGGEVRELQPWLHRIARNVAINQLARRASAHGELSDEWEDPRRSGELERRAELRAALAAIEALPDGQRAALTRAVAGEECATIGAELGVTAVAARQMVHRARVALRTAVRVLSPPPVSWLARRVASAAQRLPAPPPTIEPLVPKIAVAVAAVAVVAAPASVIRVVAQRSGHPQARSEVLVRPSSASHLLAGDGAQAQHGSPSAANQLQAGRSGAGGGKNAGPSASPAHTGPRPPGAASTAETSAHQGGAGAPASAPTGAASAPPAATDPSAGDPGANDAPAADPASTDASATDPSATDPSAGDPSATASSDPSSVDPSTTDATASDPSTTDTSTDPSSTGQTTDASPPSP